MIQNIRDVGGPALAVLATISFVSSLGISIMLPPLPLYGLSLGATPLQLLPADVRPASSPAPRAPEASDTPASR